MELLKKTVKKISNLNKTLLTKSRKRVDSLIKPVGSLGKLEELAVQLSGIYGTIYPKINKKSIIVMCADHGVHEENIAISPKKFTAIQACNITKGICGVSALAKQARSNVIVVDVGIEKDVDEPKVINKKIKYGTNNMTKGPAMTRKEAIKSLEVGIEIANQQIENGSNLLGTGEMGMGNTTPSTAIISVIGGYSPNEIVGVGANLPIDKLNHKANVIKKAIKINKPDKNDGIDVLAKVGGLEIGGMAGIMLAGAANKVPVVVDGVISTAAAIIACTIEPKTRNYLIPSHISAEKCGKLALELLNFKPILDMSMRLGEGSGAALTFNIIEAATYMNNEMKTFEECNMKY